MTKPKAKAKAKPKFTTDEFIAKAKAVHGERYDYSLTVYTGAKEKLIIICENKHQYSQQAGKHLSGTGCLKCAKKKVRSANHGMYLRRTS